MYLLGFRVDNLFLFIFYIVMAAIEKHLNIAYGLFFLNS
jgi:hypothetical protein